MRLHEIVPCVLPELTEMANLTPKYTGLEFGTVFLSTKYDMHGCRIKYYPNIKDRSTSFTVTIPDFQITDDNCGRLVKNRIRKEVVVFAIKNQEKIQDFWDNGITWDNDEVQAMYHSFDKLTDKDYKKIENLKFKK